jgi:RNA polymerase sigma factor (sigma-70 family)
MLIQCISITGFKNYSLTEKELIAGCVNRENSSQRLLFEKYAGKMMSVCLRYTNDEHAAQDILQVGFIKVFDYIHQFKHEGSFEGWMRRIFVSVAIRQLKKKKLYFAEINDTIQAGHSEAPAIVSKISEGELHQLIRKLPDGYRTVFNLVVIEGYSHDEIAAMLKIQPATSRTQLLKARKMLQSLIHKSFNIVMV